MSTLGERIRDRRHILKLTQVYIAEKLNVSRQAIHKYERDLVNIPLDKLNQLSLVLDTTPEYLLGWNLKKGVISASLDIDDLNFINAILKLTPQQKSVICSFLKYINVL